MKYLEIRSKIKTGDIFFTAGGSVFSRLIRFFTRSNVSHVGVFLIVEGRIFLWEAIEGKGVVLSLASERVKEEKISYWGRIEKIPEEKTIKKNAFDMLGKDYDMAGALLSLFHALPNQKYFCSEAVEKLLNLSSKATKRGTVPDDIARLCKQFFYLINDK